MCYMQCNLLRICSDHANLPLPLHRMWTQIRSVPANHRQTDRQMSGLQGYSWTDHHRGHRIYIQRLRFLHHRPSLWKIQKGSLLRSWTGKFRFSLQIKSGKKIKRHPSENQIVFYKAWFKTKTLTRTITITTRQSQNWNATDSLDIHWQKQLIERWWVILISPNWLTPCGIPHRW